VDPVASHAGGLPVSMTAARPGMRQDIDAVPLHCVTPPLHGNGGPRRGESDHELVAALRDDDPAAAERLLERYGARAYRLAIGITRNVSDAEEVVQDALWSVVRNVERFRGDAALGSWIYRIVANAAFQKLRRTARHRTEIALDDVLPALHEDGHVATADDWSDRLDDPAIATDLRAALSAAIDELAPAYRAVLVMRDVEGLSIAEASAALGITVANTKTRLHRARLFLRTRLAHFMDASSAA
jgi:RNA polymerase sigma-70 factor, ECF subfamily